LVKLSIPKFKAEKKLIKLVLDKNEALKLPNLFRGEIRQKQPIRIRLSMFAT